MFDERHGTQRRRRTERSACQPRRRYLSKISALHDRFIILNPPGSHHIKRCVINGEKAEVSLPAPGRPDRPAWSRLFSGNQSDS